MIKAHQSEVKYVRVWNPWHMRYEWQQEVEGFAIARKVCLVGDMTYIEKRRPNCK